MTRLPLAALLLAAALASPAAAQDRAQVTIAHTTPDSVRSALTAELAGQHFEPREHNAKHAVYSADKGSQMLRDGTELKVRYELEFEMKPTHDSLRVWLARETLVGETKVGMDRRVEQDPQKNLTSFQGILDNVKKRIESPPADSSGT